MWLNVKTEHRFHLLGSFSLHLGAAGRSRRPQQTRGDAHRQVEAGHLVLLSVGLDAVQHGQQVAQQQRVPFTQAADHPAQSAGNTFRPGFLALNWTVGKTFTSLHLGPVLPPPPLPPARPTIPHIRHSPVSCRGSCAGNPEDEQKGNCLNQENKRLRFQSSYCWQFSDIYPYDHPDYVNDLRHDGAGIKDD